MAFRQATKKVVSPAQLVGDGSFESVIVTNPSTKTVTTATYHWWDPLRLFPIYQTSTITDPLQIQQLTSVGPWSTSDLIETWTSTDPSKPASNGKTFIELDSGEKPNNAIWQTIKTEAGKSYDLSFDFAMREGTSAITNAFQVLWNGEVIKTVVPGSTAWNNMKLYVVGTGSLDKLEFREMGSDTDSLGTFLDNISLKRFATESGSGRSAEADGMIQLTTEDRAFLLKAVNTPTEIRDVSGFGNNFANPTWGTVDQPFVRLSYASYGDNFAPRGVVNGIQTLPNERTISNVISNQDENRDGIEDSQDNSFGTNLFLMSFGQFFDHGLDFIKRGSERYSFSTETGSTISITRGERTATGEHINKTSPFVDQNQTYGSHEAVTFYLRKSIGIDANGNGTVSGKSAYLLSGALDESGRDSLPTYKDVLINNGVSKALIEQAIATNNFALLASDADFIDFRNVKDPVTGKLTGQALLLDIAANANPSLAGVPGINFDLSLLLDHYVGGDGRVNENIALTPIHTIWHREHDFQVDKLKALNPRWTNEQLFEAAKIIVEMEYQRVVFDEFADAMAGGIPGRGGHGFGGYDPKVNPTISAEFAHAVYRVGHSMINETIPFTDGNGNIKEMSLVQAFLNPRAFKDVGVDALIDGSTKVLHQRIDENLVNAVRNQLLGERLSDLGAINIARGRETGLPSLNEFRRYVYENGLALGDQASDYGMRAKGDSSLKPYANWAEFAANLRDPSLVNLFKQVYGSNDSDVNKVDLWIGGLAEKSVNGQLGSTFGFVFREQLDRLQDGDRFYYKDRLDGTQLLADIEGQTFSDIIMRNSGLTYLHDDIFKAAELKKASSTAGTINGDGSHEILVANGLNNWVYAGAGDDTVYAGAGDDIVHGQDGDDGLRGEAGNDSLYGGNGDDALRGGAGNDKLYGEAGDDQGFGGAGDDIAYGSVGNDEFVMDAGNDIAFGGVGDDDLVGGDGVDKLYGEDGLDKLMGDAGNDWLYGGGHDDELNGGAGDDYLDGGWGSDWAIFDTAKSAVTVNLSTGWATGKSTGSDRMISIENVEGSNFADLIIGDGNANILEGGAGNDTMYGNNGNDILIGGLGTDKMGGGFGSDKFVFELRTEAGLGARADTILDFARGWDKIDLAGMDAKEGVFGDQSFKFLGKAGAFSDVGQLRFWTYDVAGTANDYTLVSGNVVGDKTADFSIRLAGLHSLQATDFVL